MKRNSDSCAILFSGGTDSTCVAALAAESGYSVIHLLTYYDLSNKKSPSPYKNVEILKNKFPNITFEHHLKSSNNTFLFLYKNRFYKNILKYGLLPLSNCLATSLSWHIETLKFCKDNNVIDVFDGLTNEMTHLPGHMCYFIESVKALYSESGIYYDNPVRDWEVPEDQQFIDRLIVDQHGYMFPSEEGISLKTTGKYLFDQGIFEHPNIKGSDRDRKMQHDCYPFVLHNVIVFWFYLQKENFESFQGKFNQFIKQKIIESQTLLTR